MSDRAALERALRAAWGPDTIDPVDAPHDPAIPAKGQCGVTALVVQDVLGGELLLADVTHADGSRQGVHYWNRLPDGTELDLTREQFVAGEVVHAPGRVQERPADVAHARTYAQYVILRDRVAAAL